MAAAAEAPFTAAAAAEATAAPAGNFSCGVGLLIAYMKKYYDSYSEKEVALAASLCYYLPHEDKC